MAATRESCASTNFEVTPDALIERTPVSESRMALSALEDIQSTDTHTFLYIQSYGAHVIPHTALLEGDHDTFLAALRKALPPTLDVTTESQRPDR